MTEKRSMASRFFRYSLKHSKFAGILIILGWTLALLGSVDAQVRSNRNPLAFMGDLSGVEISPAQQGIVLATILAVLGGAIAFMGMFAGISRWVAEPAARKVLSEHIREGVKAHYEYVSREEWDKKHNDLVAQMAAIEKTMATLTAALMNYGKVK